jgi:hypothetical protein
MIPILPNYFWPFSLTWDTPFKWQMNNCHTLTWYTLLDKGKWFTEDILQGKYIFGQKFAFLKAYLLNCIKIKSFFSQYYDNGKMFHTFQDGNGKIDYEEFVNMMMQYWTWDIMVNTHATMLKTTNTHMWTWWHSITNMWSWKWTV